MPDAADHIEIAEVIRHELDRLGCKCAPTHQQHVGENMAYSISEHHDDCPAVEYYSRPENQPNA